MAEPKSVEHKVKTDDRPSDAVVKASELEVVKAELAKVRLEASDAILRAEKAETAATKAMEEKAKAVKDIEHRLAKIDLETSRQEKKIHDQIRRERKIRLIIPSGKDQHERCPVALAINGREFLVVRDKEVHVPESVVHALELAVEMTPEVVEEGGQRRTMFKQTQRYPFTVKGYVDDTDDEAVA